MNKSELVDALADKAVLPKTHAEAILDAFMNLVVERCRQGEEIRLVGFGKFHLQRRSARRGINPATGKSITIPARSSIAFKPGRRLKHVG